MGSGFARIVFLVAAASALSGGLSAATAGTCPGNPNAIGTSRTIVVDPREHLRIGTMDYAETLPLVDREVVLTFDDGPLPPFTTRILDILAAQCVHATYFMVGDMAKQFPALARAREPAFGRFRPVHGGPGYGRAAECQAFGTQGYRAR